MDHEFLIQVRDKLSETMDLVKEIRDLRAEAATLVETAGGRQQLHTYRLLNGLSRRALARRLGVDTTTLWRWEAGRGQPFLIHRERMEALISELLATQGESPK